MDKLKQRYHDLFDDYHDGIMKPWVVRYRGALAVVGALLYAYIFQAVVRSGGTTVDMSTKLFGAAWTIAIPLYFFFENVYGLDQSKARANPAMREHYKSTQDAARAIWAACAAAIGLLLLK